MFFLDLYRDGHQVWYHDDILIQSLAFYYHFIIDILHCVSLKLG